MSQTKQMLEQLAAMNERTWLQIGQLAESMKEPERAVIAYESALRHNPYSETTLTVAASLCRSLEKYQKAAEYFQRILKLNEKNGEIWGALGHCYLMMDDLQKAYQAYQQALFHLPNPKEPKLWYGIGILYDRYGSYEHAEEAFSAVIRMEPNFEKANEIYFRLGIIYKQEQKYENSLECFRYILDSPPAPLTELDILFQIGQLFEQKKDYAQAKETYERVLKENPNHAKVLQQMGWLHHLPNTGFTNIELALNFLNKSLEIDKQDAQSWYLLGRVQMSQQKYNEAYDAYQQAVYRDGRNPTFWCSIGVLYYQISQYNDALDAYTRAIKINPLISEVWYDLGILYETCNNQITDAKDAYSRALELDPNNVQIKNRIQTLNAAQQNGGQAQPQTPHPAPQEMNPNRYPPQGKPGAAPGPLRQPPQFDAPSHHEEDYRMSYPPNQDWRQRPPPPQYREPPREDYPLKPQVLPPRGRPPVFEEVNGHDKSLPPRGSRPSIYEDEESMKRRAFSSLPEPEIKRPKSGENL